MGKKHDKKHEKKQKKSEPEDDEETTISSAVEKVEDGVPIFNNLRPFFGGCCLTTSLYMLFPECWGAYCNATLGCLEIEGKTCKFSQREGDICICFNLGILCVNPTLVKSVCQCCCVDGRCAIPCNHDEVPCLVNLCGLNFMYEYGCACHCCKTLGQIREAAEDRKA